MKISAPNYTQTPNICFDEIFKSLKEGELRVVLVLIRQTFGWHKRADRISLGQISEKSGMEKSTICKSLKTLIEKGIVIKNKFGNLGKERCYYSLIIEEGPKEEDFDDDEPMCDEERELISNNFYGCSKNTPPVFEVDNPQCSKDTHKRNYSKETIKQQQQAAAAVSSKDENKLLESSKEESTSNNVYVVSQAIDSKKLTQIKHNVYYKVLSTSNLEPRPFQKGSPKVYKCLESLDISQEEKETITRCHEEYKVENAVEVLKSRKTPPRSIAAFINWAASQGLKPTPKAEDLKEENKKYAEKIEKSIISPKNIRFDLLSKGIEIVFMTCSKTPIYLNFDQLSFKTQLKQELTKCGFKINENDM